MAEGRPNGGVGSAGPKPTKGQTGTKDQAGTKSKDKK